MSSFDILAPSVGRSGRVRPGRPASVASTAALPLNGIGFASGYALLSSAVASQVGASARRSGLHGAVVPVALLSIVEEVHPQRRGGRGSRTHSDAPDAGLLALHYGIRALTVAMAAHPAYGATIGALNPAVTPTTG